MTAHPGDRPARATHLGPGYRKLWIASTVTNLGDGLSIVAIPWLASAITRDPLQIALVSLATRVPWLLFSLPAGVITDRVDRRKLVATMDALRFAVMLAFAVAVTAVQGGLATPQQVEAGTGDLPTHPAPLLALIYAAAFLLGTAEVLRDNTAQTLLPSVVAKDQLEKANGRMWGAELVASQFVGPPLAGALLGLAFAVPFFVNAGAFAIAAALVFSLAGQFTPRGQTTSGRIAWRSEIGEGLRWLWHTPLLRTLAITLGAANALSTMAEAVLVLFAQEVLTLDAGRFGLLLTGAAVGGVLASLVADRISIRFGSGRVLVLSLAGMGLAQAVIGLSTSGVVVWAVFASVGFLAVQWNVITVSLRQTITPDHVLGRVNSGYRFFGWGAISLGTALGGAMVTLGETVVGREWALRLPFLVGAALHIAILIYVVPRLTTARIEQARAQASNAAGNVDS